MATKAEQTRAEDAKKGPNPKRVKKAAQKKPAKRAAAEGAPARSRNEGTKAGKKASFAKETTAPGKRPSRKSTRSSANRSKPDTNLVLRSERAKNAPSDAARSKQARTSRTRSKRPTAKSG
jgi:hypothetical protein